VHLVADGLGSGPRSTAASARPLYCAGPRVAFGAGLAHLHLGDLPSVAMFWCRGLQAARPGSVQQPAWPDRRTCLHAENQVCSGPRRSVGGPVRPGGPTSAPCGTVSPAPPSQWSVPALVHWHDMLPTRTRLRPALALALKLALMLGGSYSATVIFGDRADSDKVSRARPCLAPLLLLLA
jgi:hypothetical protein